MSVTVEIGKKPSALPVTVTVNHENLEEEFWAEAANKERYDDDEHKGNVTDEGTHWLFNLSVGALTSIFSFPKKSGKVVSVGYWTTQLFVHLSFNDGGTNVGKYSGDLISRTKK